MRSPAAVICLIIFSIVVIYWPASGFPFLNWDDDKFLLENRYLNPATFESVLRLWTELYSPNYTPLFFTVWAGMAWFSRNVVSASSMAALEPSIFHIGNIFVHILNALLVFNILSLLLRFGFRELQSEKDNNDIVLPAGMGALIFAVHPIQAEPVAWVMGFHTVLAAFFAFIAIREYLLYSFSVSGAAPLSDKAASFHYLKGILAFVFAMLVKPIVVIIPIALFLLDYLAVGRTTRKSSKSLAPWLFVSFLFALFTFFVQPKEWVVISTPLWSRPFIAGDILAFYLYKILLPFSLGIDYGRSTDYLLSNWSIYFGWLAPLSLLALFWKNRNLRQFLLPLGIFVVGIFPVIGLVPYYLHATSTVADRYLYIPMLGVSLAVSLLFLKLKNPGAKKFFLLLPLPFALLAVFQVLSWQSNTALFEKAVMVNPESAIGHTNLGTSYMRIGEFEKARKHFQISLQIKPNSPKVYNNIGTVLMEEEKPMEAVEQFHKALSLFPGFVLARHNLGMALIEIGQLDEAAKTFRQAIEIKPDFAKSHFQLGLLLIRLGEREEGIKHLRKTIELAPLSATANNDLGKALIETGNIDEGIQFLKRAVDINPANEEIRADLNNALPGKR